MANNVTAHQLGAQPQVLNGVSTVKDILTKFDLSGVSVKINGKTVDENYVLNDYDFVSLGEKVKGGLA
jgi:sulfur carrier protein ThiS